MVSTFKTRIVHKHDTEENWLKAENFSPLEAELIVYDDNENPKIKLGDGQTNVNFLPFLFDSLTEEDIAEVCQ